MAKLRSTEILTEEHRWIERMLSCLERLLASSAERGRLDSGASTSLLALFEYFADGVHQRKEEAVLYMRMLNQADLSEKACIAQLLGQHENDRRLMRNMRANLLGAVFGVPDHVHDFGRCGGAYLDLQRRHMAQENAVLLPMAGRLLDEEADELVCQGFRKVEQELGVETEPLYERIDRLCERLGVPLVRRRPSTTTTSL